MLVGCLAAALAAPTVGPWGAVVVAALAGAAVNALFAGVVAAGADQVVAGTGMVLVGIGLTGSIFRHVQLSGFGGELLPTLPWGPLELGALALVPLVGWFLAHTRAGLVIRACGENPEAAAAAGASPLRVRAVVLIAAGALVGLGGAALVLRASGSFVEGMTRTRLPRPGPGAAGKVAAHPRGGRRPAHRRRHRRPVPPPRPRPGRRVLPSPAGPALPGDPARPRRGTPRPPRRPGRPRQALSAAEVGRTCSPGCSREPQRLWRGG